MALEVKSVSRERLKPAYKNYYLNFLVTVRKDTLNSRGRIYNGLLHDFLIDCQKNKFLPSKDFVEKKCFEFNDQAIKISDAGNVDSGRDSAELMDNAIQNSDFLPIYVHKTSEDKTFTYKSLEVWLLIPFHGLTEDEVGFLAAAFCKDASQDEGCIKFKVMDVFVSNEIDADKQERINSYCLRKTREIFSKFCIKNDVSSKFKYPLMDRFRDFLLDGSI